MPDITVISVSPAELVEQIRVVVASEMKQWFDRPVSRKEIAQMYDVSLRTVDNWIAKGNIRPITPPGAHPKYSLKEITNLK